MNDICQKIDRPYSIKVIINNTDNSELIIILNMIIFEQMLFINTAKKFPIIFNLYSVQFDFHSA